MRGVGCVVVFVDVVLNGMFPVLRRHRRGGKGSSTVVEEGLVDALGQAVFLWGMRDCGARKDVVGVIKLGEGGGEVFFRIVGGDFVHTVWGMVRNVSHDAHDEFGGFGATREKMKEEFPASLVDDSEDVSVFVHGQGGDRTTYVGV